MDEVSFEADQKAQIVARKRRAQSVNFEGCLNESEKRKSPKKDETCEAISSHVKLSVDDVNKSPCNRNTAMTDCVNKNLTSIAEEKAMAHIANTHFEAGGIIEHNQEVVSRNKKKEIKRIMETTCTNRDDSSAALYKAKNNVNDAIKQISRTCEMDSNSKAHCELLGIEAKAKDSDQSSTIPNFHTGIQPQTNQSINKIIEVTGASWPEAFRSYHASAKDINRAILRIMGDPSLSQADNNLSMLVSKSQISEDEEVAMLFTDCIIYEHDLVVAASPEESSTITTLSSDDMIYLTKKFLDCQSEFRNLGKCTHVSLGYRHMHSTTFGFGVSMSSTPYAFQGEGGSFFLVAMLKGSISYSHTDKKSGSDTIIKNTTANEVVLRQSKQYLPLVQFEASMLSAQGDSTLGNNLIEAYYIKMQELVDVFLNHRRISTKDDNKTMQISSEVHARMNIPSLTMGTVGEKVITGLNQIDRQPLECSIRNSRDIPRVAPKDKILHHSQFSGLTSKFVQKASKKKRLSGVRNTKQRNEVCDGESIAYLKDISCQLLLWIQCGNIHTLPEFLKSSSHKEKVVTTLKKVFLDTNLMDWAIDKPSDLLDVALNICNILASDVQLRSCSFGNPDDPTSLISLLEILLTQARTIVTKPESVEFGQQSLATGTVNIAAHFLEKVDMVMSQIIGIKPHGEASSG